MESQLNEPEILLDAEGTDLVQRTKVEYVGLRSSRQDSACSSDCPEKEAVSIRGGVASAGKERIVGIGPSWSVCVNLF